jgi:hypothetical protein
MSNSADARLYFGYFLGNPEYTSWLIKNEDEEDDQAEGLVSKAFDNIPEDCKPKMKYPDRDDYYDFEKERAVKDYYGVEIRHAGYVYSSCYLTVATTTALEASDYGYIVLDLDDLLCRSSQEHWEDRLDRFITASGLEWAEDVEDEPQASWLLVASYG